MDVTPVFLPRRTRWAVGVDLGQSTDPTAVAVIEHVEGVHDYNSAFERHTQTGSAPQRPAVLMNVRHLQRYELGLSYPAVVQRVKDTLARPPLCGHDEVAPAELIIDETGVGRAVGDIFVNSGMSPKRVTITAGGEVACAGRDRWHVAKTVLISTVDALLHTGALRFAAALTDAPAMREELLDFRRKLSDAGRATYAARVGQHDDLVLAVAIAAWWLSRPEPPPPVFGNYGTVLSHH